MGTRKVNTSWKNGRISQSPPQNSTCLQPNYTFVLWLAFYPTQKLLSWCNLFNAFVFPHLTMVLWWGAPGERNPYILPLIIQICCDERKGFGYNVSKKKEDGITIVEKKEKSLSFVELAQLLLTLRWHTRCCPLYPALCSSHFKCCNSHSPPRLLLLSAPLFLSREWKKKEGTAGK